VGRGVGELFRPDVVAHPHLIGCDTKLVRADVNHALKKPQVLHPRVAAVRSHGTLIGHHLREVDAATLEAIGTGKHLRPDDTTQGLVARIGAAIVDMARSDGSDHAVLAKSDARVAEGALVALAAGGHVFGPRLHPLAGPPAGLA